MGPHPSLLEKLSPEEQERAKAEALRHPENAFIVNQLRRSQKNPEVSARYLKLIPMESTASGGETPTGSAVPGVDRDGPHRGRHRGT